MYMPKLIVSLRKTSSVLWLLLGPFVQRLRMPYTTLYDKISGSERVHPYRTWNEIRKVFVGETTLGRCEVKADDLLNDSEYTLEAHKPITRVQHEETK